MEEADFGVSIRPVVADDFARLDDLLEDLDDQARYRRWFTGAADVHRAAAWAAHPEAIDAVGLVAVAAGGELVGHAVLVPTDRTRAEVAFEVAAAWRRHGIAGRLLDALAIAAAARDVQVLTAIVLPENADMLAVLREHGGCQERLAGGLRELELRVPPRETTAPA